MIVGVVLYLPSKSFFSRLERLLASGTKLRIAIYDNSPVPVQHPCLSNKRVCVMGQMGNLGLGRAMHDIGQKCYLEGYDYWLYFDQDTDFNAETIAFVEKFIETRHAWPNDVASVFFTNKKEKSKNTKKTEFYRESVLPHHSGMLFCLPVLKSIGWHNPKIFLDCLDYDYCLRVKKKKMKIIEVRDTPGIDHLTNQDAVIYPIFGRRLNLSRCYSQERIKDTLIKTILLLMKSIASGQLIFFLYMIRFLVVYIILQLYAYARKSLVPLQPS